MIGTLRGSLHWGGLQHHYQQCPEIEEHEEDNHCPVGCEDGQLFWGSFYAADTNECDECGTVKRVASMFDGCMEWVCLDCYLKIHARDCDCNLWPKEEPSE